MATDAEDEARQIVDRIKAATGWDPSQPDAPQPAWSDYAVLYRKHRHREAITARLREEAIPYTVVGGLSLFETPEIRDLEQSLRAIADPLQDVALVRMMPGHGGSTRSRSSRSRGCRSTTTAISSRWSARWSRSVSSRSIASDRPRRFRPRPVASRIGARDPAAMTRARDRLTGALDD